MDILFFIVAFLSSIAGAICGIGGGIAGRKLNKRMDSGGQTVHRPDGVDRGDLHL